MGGLSTEEKTTLISQIVADKKAIDVVVLDMADASSITDYFLICSGGSQRQVQAIADAIGEQLKQAGITSLGVEGYREGHWILMDYGDVIVHVFSQETREFYDLERLWANAPKIDLSRETAGVTPHHGASVG
ncbi:MAG TPA: ribosome silencing factor [Candidatus Tectomicrobia bacterium]